MKIAYDAKELEIIGENPPLRYGEKGIPVFRRPISPKENMELLFEGKTPCWMPVVGMRGWDVHVFRPRLFPDNVATHLVYDAQPQISYDSNLCKGWFDLEWEFVPQAGGATVHPGNPKVPSMVNWEDYVSLPDIEALDWEGSAEKNKQYLETDNIRQIAFLSCLWERLISLMDVENAAVALIDEEEQEGVHRFFDKLCDMYDKMIEKAAHYYDIDMVLWHDDWGTQNSTFFSPTVHREMILPYLKRIIHSCHSRGLRFELHSCGLNETMVPLMIEAGVDMWCGQGINDFDKLAHQYREAPMIFGIPAPVFAPGTAEEKITLAAEQLVRQYEGCKVAVNCLFEFADLNVGNAIYAASRKAYLQK